MAKLHAHAGAGGAGRAIDTVLALASLSTLLGTTAGRGSGAHNICAGHGSCALEADGPKFGQGRRPGVGIGSQNDRLLRELECPQAATLHFAVKRVTTDAIARAELADGKCLSIRHIHLSPHLLLPTGIAGSTRWATDSGCEVVG